ncbi:MAG: AAA family ATPase, partial [Burkholderiaceae bacterium]
MASILTPVPDPGREFIGRQREIDALQAALDAAIDGRPGIVLLAGEPGIGKTRTAQQLADRAASRQVLALWGRCPEEPGAPPYWPWLQLIRRYVALHDAAALETTLGRAGPLIAALDPELASRLNVEATPAAVEPDAPRARFRLFDAIAGFWRRAAARQPLLLVIDDLHRADVASLRLLEFVIAEADASRVLVLGTYRDGEVTRRHPLSDTLAELNRAVKVQRLLLGGFSAAETARFLAAATGAESIEMASALHDQTAGHPLFLSELARDLPQAGSSGIRQPPGHVPKGVRDVIGARLNRLTPHCVGVLQSAAVFGREFRLDLLCRLFDELTEEQVQGALEEARIASLVGELTEPGHHQFTHALVRDTLYDELPPRRRADLHRRIGAAFESRYSPDLSGCLSVLAYHCHAAGPAGDAAKAIEYATRAAEQATAMQAHEEAALHYRHAGATLPTEPATDAQRCRLLLGLGGAENSAGLSAQALSTFAAATECARRVGDASLLARSALGFADAQWRLGIEGSQAAALIHDALAHPEADATHERCALLGALCQALLFSNRPDEAETAFREAVAIARRLDDPMTLFRALCAILPGR